jgi:hypothetical protein
VCEGTFKGGTWEPTFDEVLHFSAGGPLFNAQVVSADAAERIEEEILPGLKDGSIVPAGVE